MSKTLHYCLLGVAILFCFQNTLATPDPSGILAEIQTTFDQRYESTLMDSLYAVITSVYREHAIPIILEMDGNDTFLVNYTTRFRVGLTISTRSLTDP
jgi:hypothetical protein